MFMWGGVDKKGNRVVLEYLPPTIKDCMTASVSCINICFIGEGSCIRWKCSCA